MRFPIVVLLITGCTAGLPQGATTPRGHHRTALDSAIDAWRAEGLPWRKQCDEEYSRVRVVIAPPEVFTEVCRNRPLKAGGNLYACALTQSERPWPWSLVDQDRVPLLVISLLQPREHRRRLVIHEAMHWLGHCSGKGIDYAHADPEVWQRALHSAEHELAWRVAAQRRGYKMRHALMFRGRSTEARR